MEELSEKLLLLAPKQRSQGFGKFPSVKVPSPYCQAVGRASKSWDILSIGHPTTTNDLSEPRFSRIWIFLTALSKPWAAFALISRGKRVSGSQTGAFCEEPTVKSWAGYENGRVWPLNSFAVSGSLLGELGRLRSAVHRIPSTHCLHPRSAFPQTHCLHRSSARDSVVAKLIVSEATHA